VFIYFVEYNFASTGYLLLASFGSRFGDLAASFGFVDGFDDTDGDGLTHIPDSEPTERSILGEWFDAHWLRWDHLDDGGITRFDFRWGIFDLLTGSPVNLFQKFGEFAGNMGGVAIEDWGVTFLDLTGVVQDDDLSVERFRFLGWVVLRVGGDVTPSDVLDGDVLDVETDVITWVGHIESFVMHFDGFDLSGDGSWGKGDDHTGFQGTGFNSADWYCSDTTDLVDVLEWEPEWFVGRPGWWDDSVKSFEQGVSGSLFLLAFSVLPFDGPTFVPSHVFSLGDHVVTVPTRNGDESDSLGVVTNLLDVVGDFLDDFFVPGFGVFWLGGVHLVDTDDHLLDTQGESEEGVFPGLTVLGDTSFKFTDTGGDDEDSAISLRSTGNHVLDEIPMAWGINNGDFVFSGFEFPQSDIDGDTTFPFSLKLVQDPGIFKGTFTHFLGFLLEFFDGPLVDTTTFVDQVTSGGRFTGIDVSDDDDVDMALRFTHFGFWFLSCSFVTKFL